MTAGRSEIYLHGVSKNREGKIAENKCYENGT